LSSNINKPTLSDAIQLFERALALDVGNVLAMTNLSTALAVRADAHWGEDPTADMTRADELIDAAAALQPYYT
jgi:hypothetical protein